MVDVQTMPPCSPQNAFRSAAELIYVTGVMFCVRVEHFGELAPRALDLGQVRHVGHRAAGVHVRQDRHLRRLGKNIGDFRHEMHAAEHDVVGIGLC